MSLISTYIVSVPGKEPEYMGFKALMKLGKKAVESPKYSAWLKKQHFLPIWTETVEDQQLKSTKLEYIILYLQSEFNWRFEEI